MCVMQMEHYAALCQLWQLHVLLLPRRGNWEKEREEIRLPQQNKWSLTAFSRLKFCYLGGNPTLDYTSESQGTKCSLVAEVYPYMERVVRKYIFHTTYRDLVKRSQQKGIIHYQNKSNAHNPVMIQPPFVKIQFLCLLYLTLLLPFCLWFF